MTTKLKTSATSRHCSEMSILEQKLGPIEYRPVDHLKRYEHNPRKHPEKQIVKLAASIRKFGFAIPVLVDEAGNLIASEARVEAARRVGLQNVPVIVAYHWSGEQVRAFRLADNRLADLATWDNAALAIELAAIIEFDDSPVEILGWDTAEIDLVLHHSDLDAGADGQDAADRQIEPPTDPVSREGDIWMLGGHRLLCGSSLEQANWSALLAGETAAMVFTDPPYNVPVSGHVCGLGQCSPSAPMAQI